MKKGSLINSELSRIIAKLGHTDQITIADAGLPIPSHVERVDLALTKGIPSFMQVLENVSQEMQIEMIIVAEQIVQANPTVHQSILQLVRQLEKEQNNSISITYLSHDEFKQQTRESKAVIRTGEFTAYANIILCSGVVF